MDDYRHIFSVAKMALRLDVSVSSYYDFRRGRWMWRMRHSAMLEARIKHHFDGKEEL